MLKVRINREYKTLVRYLEINRGAEWVCVRGKYEEHNGHVWEIWQSITPAWKKRQTWHRMAICGSWANMSDMWEKLTGEIISYS